MKSRYSLRIAILGLALAVPFSGIIGVEISNISSANQAQSKQEKPDLRIINESGKETVISAGKFGRLPHQTVKAKDHSGVEGNYEGVALVELLRSAKTTLGKDLKGPLMANFALVEAADNYRVVFSLVEVDPELSDNIVLVADRKDGKALGDKQGPYQLVVPNDKRHIRWVRQVTQISVRSAGDSAASKKDK